MYDGQLYRLRKEALGNPHHQGSSSRGGRGNGRGRGGSSRGGHGSHGRGGRDPIYTDRRSENLSPNVPPHTSGRSPKIFFNDARRGVRSNARVDAVISSLRARAEVAIQAPRRVAETVTAEQRGRTSANAGPSRRPQAPIPRPTFVLASQDAFLAYAGFNSAPSQQTVPPPAVQSPSRQPSLGVTSKEDHEVPVGRVTVCPPQASQVTDSSGSKAQQNDQHQNSKRKKVTFHGTLINENQPQTLQNGDVGLEGSRWASNNPAAEQPQLTTTAPTRSPIPKPNTLATYGRTVLRDNLVQIAKGRGSLIRGYARLVKNNPQRDRYFTLELDVGSDRNFLKEEVRDSDLFTCESTIIKYRANRDENGSATKSAITWTIKFQMPYQSWTFYNPVASNPNARNRLEQPDVISNPDSDADPAPVTHDQPSKPVEELDTVHKTEETASADATERTPADTVTLQADHASTLLRPAVETDFQSTAASAGSDRMSISNGSLIFQQEPDATPSSPQRTASSEWPLIQPIADASLAGLLDKYQPGGSNRISSQAWSEMNEVAGFEPLVSLGHDEPESGSLHPMIQALLNMDDTQLIQGTLDYIEHDAGGSFLDQLSVMVAKWNIPPAIDLTGEEILSSPQYQEAAENLVGSRLCHSETFSMMPDIVTIGYTTEKTRKVLKKAIAQRDFQDRSERGTASQSLSAFSQPETGLSISQHGAESVMEQGPQQSKTEDMASYVKADGPRITYSPEDLLSLRRSASRFKIELISKEVVGYVVRLPAEGKSINPANIIGTTKSGIPIVVGRDHFSRTRSNTGGPAFKPTTTVGAWQDYSVAQSGESAELPRNIVAVDEYEASSVQSKEAAASKLVVQNVSSSQISRTSTPNKKELVLAPPKPANAIQTQETDMALWSALLTTVRDNKKEEQLRPMSSGKLQTPLVSSRGLNLSKENKEDPSTTEPEQDVPLTKSEQKSSTMNAEQDSSTVQCEDITAPDTCSADLQPPSQGQAQLLSFSAMYERIKESLFNSPLALSSRSQSMTSTTQSVANIIKSETGSIPPTPTLAVTASYSSSEFKVEPSIIASPEAQAPASLAPPPAISDQTVSSVKFESPIVELSSVPLYLEKVEPAPASVVSEIKNVMKDELEHAPTFVHTQPTELKTESETPKTSQTAASVPQVPGKTSLLGNVTNKDLKGILGLKASRWASDASAPQAPVPKAQALQAPALQIPAASTRPPPLPMIPATPIYPVYPPYTYGPPQTFGNVLASPPPVHVTMANHPPALHTVIIPDPMRPGCYMEVTGISKESPTLQPMQPMIDAPNRQENVPFFQQHSPAMPLATDMYHGHRSNKSSGSDFNLNPSNTPFTPSRGGGSNAISPQERAALSPVRQGEDVQAKLQSRLNSSLACRSPGA
ncbi:hypothetical protein L207DRAFT_268047 [Hyaloscypha variabilis F]|uniref:Uncharacterized protein n=1 Tax=Hyaloscypha variabilis (strain UAMH 11265 / GT02V1 / F) TaxID=1149755 RepID=A0A2J6RZL0_HYAVF|nr:hypothetical protein L207DRAFT_268047 [Hyaloscypha variabilis F]